MWTYKRKIPVGIALLGYFFLLSLLAGEVGILLLGAELLGLWLFLELIGFLGKKIMPGKTPKPTDFRHDTSTLIKENILPIILFLAAPPVEIILYKFGQPTGIALGVFSFIAMYLLARNKTKSKGKGDFLSTLLTFLSYLLILAILFGLYLLWGFGISGA